MRPRFRLATILAAAFLSSVAMGQSLPGLASRANDAMQAADWEKAQELYLELTRASPEDATAWYRLGVTTMRSDGEGGAARAALRESLRLGYNPAVALLAISRSHLADGDEDESLNTLEELALQGTSRYAAAQLDSDEAFAPLNGDARFAAVIEVLTPCAAAEYRQFDFWLGSWEVVSPQGQRLGTNEVTQAMDGCLLIENWRSAAGGQKGMSINYYDRDTGKWSQIYRDNTGNIAQWPELVGGVVDGVMVLDSGPDTQPRSRWKWSKLSEGRVRQMAESTADGETWNTVWDSIYVPTSE